MRQAWHGRIFLNPPYRFRKVARFLGKLFEEMAAARTREALVLVNSATSTDWFQRAFTLADAVCLPSGKIKFVHATKDGLSPCAPQTILYYGPRPERFCAVFAALGVSTRVRCVEAALPQLTLGTAPAVPAPDTALPPPDVPVPAEAPPRLRDQVGTLKAAVFQTVQQLQPCTNAQVRHALGEERQVVFAALQSLVQQGTICKEGQTYRVGGAP